MKYRCARAATFVLAGVLLLASCSSSTDGVAESAGPAAGEIDEQPSTSIQTTTLAPTSTEAVAPSDEVTTSTSTTLNDPDPDRAPPTTGTEGLDSGTEVGVAPEDLTCWRVEDFGEDAADRWRVINDGVMGGLSEGSVEYGGGVASFSGTINTNGGGFSMIRTSIFRNGATIQDSLAGAEFLRVRSRSANGRGYEVTLQDSTTNTAVMHFVDLPAPDESGWQEPVIALADLEARVFGTERRSLPEFVLGEVSTIGIILADGLDGPFSLEIDRIDACST